MKIIVDPYTPILLHKHKQLLNQLCLLTLPHKRPPGGHPFAEFEFKRQLNIGRSRSAIRQALPGAAAEKLIERGRDYV